jgi:hypothetical protein
MKVKININVDEIEFEGPRVKGKEYSFHDQIQIKKALERELTRLFSDITIDNKDSLVDSLLLKRGITGSKYYENIDFKEIDGGEELSLPIKDRNPSLVGKRLAKSIYSSLNLVDRDVRSSNTVTRIRTIMN